MQLLLNNIEVEIDEQTIIGFEIQAYDITEPGRPKITISNNFTIPLTSKNLAVIGFGHNSQVDSDVIYNQILVKYIIDNEVFLDGARARLEKVSDRIELFIYQKNSVWDTFKKTKIPSILPDLLTYLNTKYSYPLVDSKHTGTYGAFVSMFIEDHGLKIPYYFSNLSLYQVSETEPFFEGLDYITLADGTKQGGHLALYLKDFIQFLEYKYSVDFQTEETFDGNIFNDAYASKTYVPFQGITMQYDSGYFLSVKSAETYDPLKDISIKDDKSIYDLLTAYFKHFNCLIDTVWKEGEYVYKVYRFDDISTFGNVINWSGNLDSNKPIIFKPSVDKWAQNSIIKFNSVFEGGNDLLNSKTIAVANENIESESIITDIDSFVCGFTLSGTSKSIPVLNTTEPFNGFVFFVDSGLTENVTVHLNSDSAVLTLDIPALYSLASEYSVLATMMNKPKFYEVEKWLTLSDIRNLRFFAQYYFEELGGSYFINKISGFNPAKKNVPTKLELIKISNATPTIEIEGNYWVDGIPNKFVDGQGNYFIW